MRLKHTPLADTIKTWKRFRVIVVSGPQRSGTTIASRIIADVLGYGYIDEDDYGTQDKNQWLDIISSKHKVVIHSPAMSLYLPELAKWGDVLTVFMLRNVKQIVASERRIGWDDARERAKYGINDGDKRPISVIKYERWKTDRRKLRNTYNLKYNELSFHPYFTDRRANFAKRQWLPLMDRL